MIEPEIAFADLAADADLAEALLKSIFRTLLDERGDDMAFFRDRIDKTCIDRLEHLIESNFERMDYTVAIEALTPEPDFGLTLGFASRCCALDDDAAAGAGATGAVEPLRCLFCV